MAPDAALPTDIADICRFGFRKKGRRRAGDSSPALDGGYEDVGVAQRYSSWVILCLRMKPKQCPLKIFEDGPGAFNGHVFSSQFRRAEAFHSELHHTWDASRDPVDRNFAVAAAVAGPRAYRS